MGIFKGLLVSMAMVAGIWICGWLTPPENLEKLKSASALKALPRETLK